ncbi:aminoglycoside phosphotransferase [Streptomyces endophyticus]|uniref:Aminoglycoside phosphotransferase n=1 Tax=Streptomyces endophyticus TaxID=714166 RepID=A0ABU6FB86_9ACTN|nr:aminoglycoside phosphotransferase [Streptomyces endophyticus]MEB8341301.1 aminoglycoside phosphotransferase [Streptomyces endophyticus]
MAMPRLHFEELNDAVREAITDKTGTIYAARTAGGGMNSGVAALLDTDSGPVFVKGIPHDHPQVHAQQREAVINPYLPDASPRLHWHIEAGGWDLLGYEVLPARHADYRPGSPDLDLVVAAVDELQKVKAPDVDLKRAEQRWGTYAPPGTAGLFAGDRLLHTDFAPDNVLIDDRAHIIDWAWPTQGAAWIDPAVLILRLMDAGHQVAPAEAFAWRFASWRTARRTAKRAFAAANAALWQEIAEEAPTPWKRGMSRHAAVFHTYMATAV